MSAEPTPREYTPPPSRYSGKEIHQAERMRARPDALRTIGEFYRGVIKPTRAENEHLARTDRNELARRNIPLVVYVVTSLLRIQGKSRNGKRAGFMHGSGAKVGFGKGHRYKVDDLIQDGIVGLIRASQTFDPARGTFSTYAIPWIIHAIQNGDTRQSTVHLPDEVQRQMRLEPEVLSESQRQGAQRVMNGYANLDAPWGSESEFDTMADYIPEPEHDADAELISSTALDALDPLERRVVEHRYGITGPPLDLAATGTKLGMTRREVRETERRAMQKMQAAT